MDLSVWSSDWGLASVDPHCLSMMTYSRLSGAPVQFRETNDPFRSPSGRLPFVRQGQDAVVTAMDFHSFVRRLKEIGFSADHNLTSKQRSDAVAFSCLVEEKLIPALLHVLWLDARNAAELTRPWYARKLRLPFSAFYPSKMARRAGDIVRAYVDGTDDPSVIENAIYRSAEECITILSKRLGDENHYFFGRSPSSLDALIYGYLAPLLRAPMPNPALQNHLKACGNLVSFVGRISQTYFPQAVLDFEKRKSEENEESSKYLTNGELIRPLAVGAFGVLSMAGYAYFSGWLGIIRGD